MPRPSSANTDRCCGCVLCRNAGTSVCNVQYATMCSTQSMDFGSTSQSDIRTSPPPSVPSVVRSVTLSLRVYRNSTVTSVAATWHGTQRMSNFHQMRMKRELVPWQRSCQLQLVRVFPQCLLFPRKCCYSWTFHAVSLPSLHRFRRNTFHFGACRRHRPLAAHVTKAFRVLLH